MQQKMQWSCKKLGVIGKLLCSSSWTYMFLRLFTKQIETRRPLIVPFTAFKHSTLLEAPWWPCWGSGGEGRRGRRRAGKGTMARTKKKKGRKEGGRGELWRQRTLVIFRCVSPNLIWSPRSPPFPFPLLLLRLLPFPFSLIFFSAAAQTMQKERDFSIFSLFVLLFYMGVCVWALDLLCLHVGFSCQRTFVKKKKEGEGGKSKLFSFGYCGNGWLSQQPNNCRPEGSQ